VAITALLLNDRGFASIDARFAYPEGTMNSRFASLEQRLSVMQTDLKEFQAEHDKRISRLEG
jgi:hypothetical protein